MRSKKAKHKSCLLCGAKLTESPYEGLFLHPVVQSAACRVQVTDQLGLSVDELYGVDDQGLFAREAVPVDDVTAMAVSPLAQMNASGMIIDGDAVGGQTSAFLSADSGAKKLFEAAGLPFLGGMSGKKGWSSISTYQKCKYLWWAKYGSVKPVIDDDIPRGEALEIGILVHLFLAIHYSAIIDSAYPLTPTKAHEFLQAVLVTPSYLEKAWQLFQGYLVEHHDELEWMVPLAVEHLAFDPRDENSCRWDLVFAVTKPHNGILPGVYVVNSKTASTGGIVTMNRWKNDGQIFGEVDLYSKLKYEKIWGPLRGACINLIIKTQNPSYRRVWVFPSKNTLRSHNYDRAIWVADMAMAAATGLYPRSRASCVTEYQGLCELHDHCAGADAPREIVP